MTYADEPSFPTSGGTNKVLTKREYFAALAMHGLLIGAVVRYDQSTKTRICCGATEYADALLAELAKVTP